MTIADIFDGTYMQLVVVISGSLVAVSDGMAFGWSSPSIPYLLSNETHIPTTEFEAELIETMGLVGAFFGLPLTIYCVQKTGRKICIQLSAVGELISWTFMCFATNIPLVLAGRFASGMAGNMCFVAAPMYIAEIADHKIRGFLSSLIFLMMLIGMVIVYATGAYCSYIVPPLIGMSLNITQLVVFSFMPESPYYLIQGNKMEKAKKCIKMLKPKADIDVEVKQISGAIERQAKTEKSQNILKDLFFVKSNRKALIIMLILNGGQHFAGITVLYLNLHLILEEADSIYMDTKMSALIFAVIMLTAATITSFVMDSFGRRLLLIISAIFSAICLLLIALYFHFKTLGYDVTLVSFIPAVSVMVYAAAFKCGLGLVPIVVTAEIFSQKIKAVGMTLADSIYIVAGIAALQMYYFFNKNFGVHFSFYLFTICACGVAIFTYFCIPETKGKTLDEIQMILENRKSITPSVCQSDRSSTLDTKNQRNSL